MFLLASLLPCCGSCVLLLLSCHARSPLKPTPLHTHPCAYPYPPPTLPTHPYPPPTHQVGTLENLLRKLGGLCEEAGNAPGFFVLQGVVTPDAAMVAAGLLGLPNRPRCLRELAEVVTVRVVVLVVSLLCCALFVVHPRCVVFGCGPLLWGV